MIKFLAASILLLAMVDIGLTRGEHVQEVIKVLGNLVHYVMHMGDGTMFGK